jgi:type I restriction enzyme, S subunit
MGWESPDINSRHPRKLWVCYMLNNNLLQQLDTLYDEFSHRKNWSTVIINDIAEKVAMGPFGSNIKVSTFVSEGVPIISGNHQES